MDELSAGAAHIGGGDGTRESVENCNSHSDRSPSEVIQTASLSSASSIRLEADENRDENTDDGDSQPSDYSDAADHIECSELLNPSANLTSNNSNNNNDDDNNTSNNNNTHSEKKNELETTTTISTTSTLAREGAPPITNSQHDIPTWQSNQLDKGLDEGVGQKSIDGDSRATGATPSDDAVLNTSATQTQSQESCSSASMLQSRPSPLGAKDLPPSQSEGQQQLSHQSMDSSSAVAADHTTMGGHVPDRVRSSTDAGCPLPGRPAQSSFSPRSSSLIVSTRLLKLPSRNSTENNNNNNTTAAPQQAGETTTTNSNNCTSTSPDIPAQTKQQQPRNTLEEQTQQDILSASPKSFTHHSVHQQHQHQPQHHHQTPQHQIQPTRSFNLPSQQQQLQPDRQPLFKSRSDPTSCLDDTHPFRIPQPNHLHHHHHHHHHQIQTRPSPNKNQPRTQSSMESSQSTHSSHQTSTHNLIDSSSSSSAHHQSSLQTPSPSLPPNTPPTPSTGSSPRQPCAKCRQSMTGQFVRALGTVYHLNCFRCQDCGKVVASKFFPVDSGSPDGRTQYPLCETDYFRRLGLICAKCGGALRGSYITALDMKFHVEHFTCSVCPTVFGPQDSYYEHSGQVYCHFHYSTRFAVKCTGCRTAILKQFVEINRNNTDEHWHPECYMINKFWNIKLAVSSSNPQSLQPSENNPSHIHDTHSDSNSIDPSSSTAVSTQTVKSSQASVQHPPESPENWRKQETYETAQTLKEKQKQMEEQVYRIWTVLSTFEESSAACISEMLRHVSSGLYLEGVRMAGKFVLHVETLFAAIDDLDVIFRSKNAQEISHVREARMLCKKIVNFFSLLSHTHETGARKMSITKELLSLVTGLAHYLKILIRIALTSALKLEREYSDRNGILQFLSRLDRLARDPDASKATTGQPSAQPDRTGPSSSQNANTASANGKLRPYGYKSLTRAVGTLVGKGEATTDLCEGCKQTVEEECVRFGTSARWHTACLKCSTCQRPAIKPEKPANQLTPTDNPPSCQLPPIPVKRFKADVQAPREGTRLKFVHIYCDECAAIATHNQNLPPVTLKDGFESVTRLEQYAFLLCVALNKLYGLLKQRGILPASADDPRFTQMNGDERSLYDAYRNSTDIKRMKSVDLDRKLSTTARIPQRSTVVESPSGRVAQSTNESQQQQNGGGHGSSSLRPNDPAIRQSSSRSPVGPIRQTQDRQRPSITHPTRERDFTNLPRTEPPPRPPPTHLNLIPQGNGAHLNYPTSSMLVASPPVYGDLSKQQYTTDVRPALARNLTAVRIVNDHPAPNELMGRDEPRLGSSTSPVGRDTEGITLADLPRAMEAEQFREQQKPLPTQVATLSELSALESVIVKHVAALTLASESSAIKDDTSLDELLEIIEARKGNFWGKLFKGGNDKAKIKKKGVFGVPLDVLIERHGVDSLLGAGAGQLRVPSFVDDCISAMKQMDMSVEGVFRKNGNIRRLKELTDAIDRDDSNVNFSDDNAVQLAALLKKFLRDLPDPLLTFKLYHLFIASQRVENDAARRKTLHLICCLLPKAHRDTMEVLFVFMKWVASFSHVDEETGSKMDLQNLATVITPNILYARSKDPTRDESFLAIRAVNELLEYQDELFQMPPEVQLIMQDQELLSSNMNEITSKDILKRVEALLKANHGKLRAPGKVGTEHYRGKGEVQPHRPDLHASSVHQSDGARAEQQQGRTAQYANGHPAEPNGYPGSPALGPPTPNRPLDPAAHLHHQLRESSLHSPSQQRHSFHRDQTALPSSSSSGPSLPHPSSNSSSKLPSPSSITHLPASYPPHPPPHPSNLNSNSNTNPSFFPNDNSSLNPSSTSSSTAPVNQRNTIPLDQRSVG
ncbi:hypothetical protein PGT21_028070 [Puccinia graminis f. sp. tritici]|uniref:Uncharacterized protein n=1 Tax=Puccinia graminis f. sp. tritici TaxID=56615 RepID=A0A5B0R9Y3_PUCGR|nr:hypothetical protein PGT21_028070 [Puccinia graminis f. sp. tritici]KAA1121614.1 hypothetical protein PGTUg99_033832 [Puccinia graminis f. sp. tritici]